MSRVFDNFPEGSACPICGASSNGKTILVPVAGTQDGNICEAAPTHLDCLLGRVLLYPKHGAIISDAKEWKNG